MERAKWNAKWIGMDDKLEWNGMENRMLNGKQNGLKMERQIELKWNRNEKEWKAKWNGKK